jgi:hypothetical protein
MSTWEMMFGTRWIELTRRNQVKRIFGQKLWTVIMRFALRFALLRKCKKSGPQLSGLEARTCSFEAIFSLELRKFNTPSSQISLNWLENRSQARKKRKNTIGERFEELKNRARNRRSFWCTLFSCCVVV